MVVAGHPQAAKIGVDVLRAGGNAVDAAVAVSLALGVAEPYGSGLGGKIMLLYYDAKTERTHVIDGLDQASWSLKPDAYRRFGEKARTDGWRAVCVPGLTAGLYKAHESWGKRPWAQDVQPAIDLARAGFEVLPKTRDLFEERLDKLRGGDAEIVRLYLPEGKVPAAGSRLANEDLARTMEIIAQEGADGFYRGAIARDIVAASTRGGGMLTTDDFARYEARLTSPIEIDFRGARIVGGPPPATGAALYMTILKALEPENLSPPLRSTENIDLIGRVWREVQPAVQRTIADSPDSRCKFEELSSPESIMLIRRRALATATEKGRKVAYVAEAESVHASTTHFAIVDVEGNIVCATQSLSLHFGAGVVAAGIIMNDSMSNFAFAEEKSPNYLAPGKRPRSTISPTLVFRGSKPILAMGLPGAGRIPTAVLQGLIDYLALDRSMVEAIGDTRLHWYNPLEKNKSDAVEAESSLPEDVVRGLRARGWDVTLREAAGTGRHFGGLNVIELKRDGTRIGYADPRRTNAAVGY